MNVMYLSAVPRMSVVPRLRPSAQGPHGSGHAVARRPDGTADRITTTPEPLPLLIADIKAA